MLATDEGDSMMISKKTKRVAAVIVTLILILAVVALTIEVGSLRLQMAFAEEQLEVFEMSATKSKAGSTQQAIGSLAYVLSYYPSGTKQRKGSRGDNIVEIGRRLCVASILDTLRQKTRQDFGDDPRAWLREFAVFLPDQNNIGQAIGDGRTRSTGK